jgi:hypothetical protein
MIRDRKGNPRGYVVAKVIEGDNSISIGWSYTNFKAGDRFNKQLGQRIAEERADKGTNKIAPHEVEKAIMRMEHRAIKYFKNIPPVFAEHSAEINTSKNYD